MSSLWYSIIVIQYTGKTWNYSIKFLLGCMQRFSWWDNTRTIHTLRHIQIKAIDNRHILYEKFIFGKKQQHLASKICDSGESEKVTNYLVFQKY